jgi:tol-pal system protein YbgF
LPRGFLIIEEQFIMKKITLCLFILFASPLFADTPNMTLTPANGPSQQLSPVEYQQIHNLLQLNLPQKIEQLEQNIQDLQGILEIQGHQIQTLEKKRQATTSTTPTRPISFQPIKITTPQIPTITPSTPETSSVPITTAAAVQAQATPSNPVNTPAAKEQQAYQQAFMSIKTKQYTQAIDGMKTYLSTYPNGKFVPNAHYWLGELYAISGDNQAANDQFNRVVNQYQASAKVPDALLKLGSLAEADQNYTQAKADFRRITTNHPDTPAARIANTRLLALAQSGR